jgi:hypothetical protein
MHAAGENKSPSSVKPHPSKFRDRLEDQNRLAGQIFHVLDIKKFQLLVVRAGHHMPVILGDQYIMIPRHEDVLKLKHRLDRRVLLTYDSTSRPSIGLKFIIQIVNLNMLPFTQRKHILAAALGQYLRDHIIIKVLLIVNGGAPHRARPIATLHRHHDILVVSLGPAPLSSLGNDINIKYLKIPILTRSKLIFVPFTNPHKSYILLVQPLKMVNNFSFNIQFVHN